MVPCPACRGGGTVSFANVTCSMCNGERHVWEDHSGPKPLTMVEYTVWGVIAVMLALATW